MLMNFCDACLCPQIKCDAVSTEGYEVTNLINGSSKGFLAYSCIKPPINIDITFLCNIRINHILIWPSVGSQRSSGFQLYGKINKDAPYMLLSNGYLNPCDKGLLFYPINIDFNKISVPANFLKRYIKVYVRHLTVRTNSLRISICKTENSVPALGKIEIWGTVSPSCGNDITANIHNLWSNHQPVISLPIIESKTNIISKHAVHNNRQEDVARENFEIPEIFLDAITYELMIQPITLPSGNVIDQSTLEKYEQNEAVWGRPSSDPFTGIPFSEHRKPIIAAALKSRIDKFLLDNSDLKEIKTLPRVLGHTLVRAGDRRIIEVSKYMSKNLRKRTARDIKLCNQEINNDLQRTKKHCHQLPAVITCSKKFNLKPSTSLKQIETEKMSSVCVPNHSSHNQNKEDTPKIVMTDIDNSLDSDIKILLSNIKRFNTTEKVELHDISNNCKCCNNNVLYRLPCKHVICRKILLSIENSQCKSCGLFYKSSDVERWYFS